MAALDLPARLLRRSIRRGKAQKRFVQINQDTLPILFANSFPKSGTHLLTQILDGFSQLAPFASSGLLAVRSFEGESGKLRDVSLMAREIRCLLPGDISYGHVHAYPELVSLLAAEGMASCFIYRDPRDVVVSHVHYVTEINSSHVHHRHYVEVLSNFDERLTTSIRGLPDAQHPFPDIRKRFEPYLDWFNRQEIHALRFEDLINAQEESILKLVQFVRERGFSSRLDDKQIIQALSKNIDPSKSPTFRSGGSGAWKQRFTAAHKALFKELSGDLLIRLGYEKDQNW